MPARTLKAKALAVAGALLRLTVGLVLIAVVLGGATLAALQTAPGRVAAANVISWAASGPDRTLKLDGLTVGWGLDVTLERARLGDGTGDYLTLEGLALAWQPTALLGGRVAVDALTLDRLALDRLPAPADEPEPAEPAGEIGLPNLPAIDLGRAAIGDIALGPAVAGTAMRLTADARGQVAAEGLTASLSVERTDGTAGALSADIAFVPARNRLDLALTGSEPRGGLAARLLDIPGLPALDLSVTGAGPLSDWSADLALKLDGETEVSGTARLTSAEDTRRLTAGLDGRLARLAPPVAQAVLLGDTRLTATAELGTDFTPRSLTADLTTQTLSLDVEASRDAATQRLTARVDGRLSAGGDALIALDLPERRIAIGATTLAISADGPLDALDWQVRLATARLATTEAALSGLRARLSGTDFDARQPLAPLAVELAAEIAAIEASDPALAAFNGPADLDATARIDAAAQGVTLETARLTLAALTASATGDIAADALDATLDVEIPRIGAFDPRLAGATTLTAALTGTPAAPRVAATATAERLMLDGNPVEGLRLTADVDVAAPRAEIDLAATLEGQDLTARLHAEPDGPGARIDPLTLASGDNRIEGALRIADLARALDTLSGELTIDASDLSAFSTLALTDLGGALEGTLSLTERDGVSDARLALSGRDVVAAGTTIGTLSADLAAQGPLTAPRLAGEAEARALAFGETRIARATLSATSEANAETRVQLDARLAEGNTADGLALDARLVPEGDGLAIVLAALDGRYRGIDTRLSEPARISVVDGAARIEALSLRLGSGTLTLAGTAGDRLDLTARADRLPLALANSVAPGFGLAGALSGSVDVTGAAADPRAAWTLSIAGLGAAPLRSAGVGDLALASNGSFQGMRLTQRTQVTGTEGLQVVAEGPVTVSGAGALDLSVSGQLPLGVARRQLLLAGLSAQGAMTLAGRINGSFAAPQVALTLTPNAVALTHLASGLALREVAGTVRVTRETVTVDGLAAAIAAGGRLSADGSIGLDGGMPADLSLTVTDGQYSDGRIVRARVNADLRLNGPLASPTTPARLSGTVTIPRADITIPSSLPGTIDPVSVTHRNAPEDVRRQDAALHGGDGGGGGGNGGGRPLALDVTVTAPGQIFVRGRGLDAELGGSLRLVGTSADPQAVGGFSLRRGVLQVLTRRVNFDKGEASFAGSLMPDLDFAATSQAGNAAVTITVRGPASKPQIAFTSSPDLPQDEILARFLFGRGMSDLSPAQIAQLGASVLALTGGGGEGPLGQLRQALGVDAIDVDTSDADGPTVSVGKYLDDNIYLGVKQGTRDASSRVTVDIDVTRSLKLRGEVGADGESKAGIFFEREFGD